MKLRSTVFAAVLAAASAAASAQEAAESPLSELPVVGSRVRLSVNAVPGRPGGIVIAVDKSALTLVSSEGGVPFRIPTASIRTMELNVGHKRQTLKGAVLGVAAGALLGLAFPVDARDCGPESSNFCSRGEAIAGSTLVFGALGTAIGAVVKTDRWIGVALSPTQARGHRPGFGVVVAARF